ncbi:DNA-directed RNA polymerase subunit beta [Bacillus sp. WMMC1349]|uniref:DUF5819 family protein n=1 Tax=Bacillus sp. WMMC1349 TaxID=2736254 RepID=UPI00155504C3|nr:DUF5819 family protein [Bacillus sp. WMMC1349]NPC91741.1 DNA-directed RNA polymerase subunit beta [Bacillus sp. WMMC1349]
MLKMKKVFFIVICILFVFHFSLTALYVLPFNPIKNKINAPILAYMHPLFAQNWQLFAPNPLSRDTYVNVQVRDKNGEESSWIDISTPLYDANHKNRISPINTLVRLGTGAYMQTVNEDKLMNKIELKKSMENPHLESQNNKDKELTDYQKDGIQMLYNLGQHYAEIYFKNQNIEELRVRVLRTEPIPFSKRNNQDYERKQTYITYDWEKYYN